MQKQKEKIMNRKDVVHYFKDLKEKHQFLWAWARGGHIYCYSCTAGDVLVFKGHEKQVNEISAELKQSGIDIN